MKRFDRKSLLASLDRVKRVIDDGGQIAGLDRFEQQALDMIVRGAGEAFDLAKEAPRTIARYDTREFRVGKKVFQPSSLGHQMLLARRLVEADCGFVTVQNSGWDMHADGNNPGIGPGMDMLGPPLDIQDLTGARELVSRARSHFGTPHEIAVNHLCNHRFVDRRLREWLEAAA